ncbi:MAG TPA: hypothetical protein VK972_09250, partial [Wenzhouxiangella sp.]|nr:hypothetical protein [Wenzhouxiangella sp.]
MSNDHFSFSMPLGGSPSPGADATHYLAPPFDARVADSGHALLLIQGDTQVRRLPLQLVQVLGQCNRLRTLDGHQREAACALRVAPHQTAAIRQALDELVRQGLLQTEADILARLKGPEDEPDKTAAQSIRYLFVRTCARPETLDRLLATLARRPLPEGLARVVVLDDGADPQCRAKTRSVVDRH